MISANKDDEINLLTHLVFCANTLAKELGLGYSGNPRLDQVAWIDQPTTQLIFDSRSKEEVTLDEFKTFFMETCKSLPDLPFAALAPRERGAAAELGAISSARRRARSRRLFPAALSSGRTVRHSSPFLLLAGVIPAKRGAAPGARTAWEGNAGCGALACPLQGKE